MTASEFDKRFYDYPPTAAWLDGRLSSRGLAALTMYHLGSIPIGQTGEALGRAINKESGTFRYTDFFRELTWPGLALLAGNMTVDESFDDNLDILYRRDLALIEEQTSTLYRVNFSRRSIHQFTRALDDLTRMATGQDGVRRDHYFQLGRRRDFTTELRNDETCHIRWGAIGYSLLTTSGPFHNGDDGTNMRTLATTISLLTTGFCASYLAAFPEDDADADLAGCEWVALLTTAALGGIRTPPAQRWPDRLGYLVPAARILICDHGGVLDLQDGEMPYGWENIQLPKSLMHSASLRWHTSDVAGLAATIVDDDRPELMPILGDALMDAGCEDDEILEKCRKPTMRTLKYSAIAEWCKSPQCFPCFRTGDSEQ